MEHKIIVIDVSFDENRKLSEKFKDTLNDLQLELFNNGYRWIKSGKEIKNFYSSRGYLVLIDNDMYSMTEESIRFLKRDNDVHSAGTAVSYFRYLKLKKLNIV